MSSYLFQFCYNGLASLMQLALQSTLVKGARISRRGPPISHLLFG